MMILCLLKLWVTLLQHSFNPNYQHEVLPKVKKKFKRRVARIFLSPGCKNPSYRMKKILTYIWEHFLITCGYRFYTLLIPKVTWFVA